MQRIPNNVLVVEDDPGMVRLLSRWLEVAGYQVRTAENGRQAVEVIRQERPDFLVTDWEMPYLDGLDLCRWVRSQALERYIYVVMITARAGQQDLETGLDAGADEYVRKPVNKEELLARLRSGSRVIELERRLRELARLNPLTGLFTRNTFLELLEKEWSRAARHHLPMSCALVEIDQHRRLGDEFGWQAVEQVEQQLARTLASVSRTSDVLSHFASGTFAVLLPETREHQGAEWARRLVSALRETPPELPPLAFPAVTISIGIAERMRDTQSPAQLIELAEQALLLSQRSGGGRIVEHRGITHRPLAELATSDPAAFLEMVPARAVMTPLTSALRQDETAGQAARFFLRLRTNSAPVVDDDGKLVGILSEKDVMSIMLQPGWAQRRISEVMQRNVVFYDESSPATAIYDFLCRVTIRGVAIVDGQGRPVGMINRGSLLRFFTNALAVGDAAEHVPPLRALTADLPHSAHDRISMVVQALAAEVARMQERLEDDARDFLPNMVGGVSRVQELVSDILRYSRAVDAGAEALAQAADDRLQAGMVSI
jgi:diguanylate cyclase (GGDEF)-like protein